MTANAGATSNNECKCQADLGWLLEPGSSLSVCAQIVDEIGGVFELAVELNDFANDVGQVQTNFTQALATAFNADPMNITLVYYESVATNPLQQQRRLLQSTTTPATTVESKIKVFASETHVLAADVSARLLKLVPGITIRDLQTGSSIVTAPVTAPPATTPPPVTDTIADNNFQLYAIIGGGSAAVLLLVIGAVILYTQLFPRKYNHYGQPNYDEAHHMDNKQGNMSYHVQGQSANSGYSYHEHGYNALHGRESHIP